MATIASHSAIGQFVPDFSTQFLSDLQGLLEKAGRFQAQPAQPSPSLTAQNSSPRSAWEIARPNPVRAAPSPAASPASAFSRARFSAATTPPRIPASMPAHARHSVSPRW